MPIPDDLDPLEPAEDAPTVAAPSSKSTAPTRAASPSSGRVVAAPRPPAPDMAAEIARARVHPSKRLGRFLLLAELGRGGMGAVYRAWDEKLERVVALKTVLEAADEGAIKRFHREAQAVARLKHASIVSVHDVGEDGGKHWLAMDLVEGKTLKRRLRPGDGETKIPLTKALEAVRDVARAVQYAHESGVLHRDLKPENIMIDDAGRALVLDFGLAKLREGAASITKTGSALGTPAYMPPEQAAGTELGEADERSDVYSLGGTLYFVLTGRPPFEGESEVNVITALLTKDPAPPRASNPRIARDLETICLKALEKDRGRYATAGDLARDLDRYLAGEPIEARPIGGLERGRRWVLRNRAVAATLVLGALVGAGGTAILAGHGRRPTEDPSRTVEEALAAFERETTPRPGEDKELLAVLTRVREPGPIAAVARAVDALALEESAAVREVVLAVAPPSTDPATTGAPPGLEAELERWLASPRATRGAALEQALGRLAAREKRPWRDALASAEEGALGSRKLALLPDACEALGDAGVGSKEVVAALAHYLAVEQDEGRAAAAGVALARLSRLGVPEVAEAASLVVAARDRFGLDGVFTQRVRGELGAGADARAEAATTVEELVRRAMLRQQSGDLGGAAADCERALALDARSAPALAARAWVKVSKGDLDGAIADASRAIELDPGHIAAWKCRAVSRDAKRDFAGAIADASKALELDPRDSFAWNCRGWTKYETNDLDGSILDFSRALEVDPRFTRAWFNRMTARLRKGDLDGSIADASRVLELDPRAADAWAARASARMAKGDPGGAIADASEALEQDRNQAMALKVRGVARRARGDLPGAASDLGRFLELVPGDSDAPAIRDFLQQNAGR